MVLSDKCLEETYRKMIKINHTVYSLWCGENLNWVAHACLKSFVRHGHDVRLYCYRDVSNVPKGVITMDAREILPEGSQFQFQGVRAEMQIGSYSPFSDYFRYTLMTQKNGIWIDSDLYCIKPFDFHQKYIFASENDKIIGNAVLRFPGNSKMCKGLTDIMTPPYEMPPWIGPIKKKMALEKLNGAPYHPGNLTYAAYGPIAVTYFAKKYGTERYKMPKNTFYPVHFTETNLFSEMPSNVESVLTDETYAIHLWYSQLKQHIKGMPPKDSFLHRIWLEGHGNA